MLAVKFWTQHLHKRGADSLGLDLTTAKSHFGGVMKLCRHTLSPATYSMLGGGNAPLSRAYCLGGSCGAMLLHRDFYPSYPYAKMAAALPNQRSQIVLALYSTSLAT